jgi:hypothetical protein
MPLPVSLSGVAGELTLLNDELRAYLNRQTGETIILGYEQLAAVEEADPDRDLADWEAEDLAQATEVAESDDWLELPSAFDIHEYATMQRFCESVQDAALSEELLDRIRGRGAFGRFKASIRYHGIEEDWYRFLEAALQEIAAEWLDEHNIPYVRP